MGPVACLIHVDVVPRRAVRKVGPRSDLSRSTHIGEPCGPARLLGDGSRSSCSPYRATHQSTGGGRMKNGGSNPPAPGSRCAGAPGRRVPSRGLRVYFHRSEEHTSELQSLAYLVCRLLLEKKNTNGTFS